jgi:hypothetical protein
VIGPSTLAFADYKGNRQLLSTGNLAANPRVALFLMDYPQRTRLKILGYARVEDAREHPELVAQIAEPVVHRLVGRLKWYPSIGTVPSTLHHATPPEKSRNWSPHSNNASRNSKPN